MLKRKFEFVGSEPEIINENVQKRPHLHEDEPRLILRFHKNMNQTDLKEKVNY